MEYITLGSTELKISRIGLGMMSFGDPKWRNWVLPEAQSLEIIRQAVDLGVNFFDTADVYSLGKSEEITGKAIEFFPNREDIIIATKVYFYMENHAFDGSLSRSHIRNSIDESLRRLGTDYVDIYQIHRFDYKTPMEETMDALNEVVKSGKARYIGASSMYAYQFVQMQNIAQNNGWPKFSSMQNHYNLVYREEEREVIPYCIQEGIPIIPWSPLGRGFLVGNRNNDESKTKRSLSDQMAKKLYGCRNDYDIAKRLKMVATKLGKTPAQIAIAWLLSKTYVASPIVGVTKLFHINELVSALNISLDETDIKYLEDIYKAHPILGHF